MELVNDRRISKAVMSPSVAAVCQQGIKEDSDDLEARDNETWCRHLGRFPSHTRCDDTRARENLRSEEDDTTEDDDLLGASTPAGRFPDSCDADNIWRRYRFQTNKWADDEDCTDSEPRLLDGDTDCCATCPSSCSTATTSPSTTTCASEISCDDEPTISEADVAEYQHDDLPDLHEAYNFGDIDFPAELYTVAARPYHATLAQRLAACLAHQGVVRASALDRGFYVAVLGSLRVLERYGADKSEIEASLVYAAIYLQSAPGLPALSQHEIAYRAVLSVCLAFSFISDNFISMGKWKHGLAKDVVVVGEKTVPEMSADLMIVFKDRGYILRPSEEELRRSGVAEGFVRDC